MKEEKEFPDQNNGRETKGYAPYIIENISTLDGLRLVRMSFELPYRDWCILEKSDFFHRLTEFLEEAQKQNTQSEPLMPED